MGKIIDEYMDIKLQQKCVSKIIDTLWEMAQKYQKIERILNWKEYDTADSYHTNEDMINEIREVIKGGELF